MLKRASEPAALLFAVIGATVLLAVSLQWLVERRPTSERTADTCEGCHRGVEGVEAAHRDVGCAGCHLGQKRATDAPTAHAGMVRLPGQLTDVDTTCGTALCHPSLPLRLRSNIMTTMNGVVSVDRWVFDEQPHKSAHTPVAGLGRSPADSHLRNLCASCHLGTAKIQAGPVTERARGGGCLACHLDYDEKARGDLARRVASRADGGSTSAEAFAHPRLTSRVGDHACFGCHSRSGRVSLNYQGWYEGAPSTAPDGGIGAGSRTLEDGRQVWRAAADAHSEGGLGCTDCHGSWEVMGDGRWALHREDQAAVGCSDCHTPAPPFSVPVEELDSESRRLARRDGLDRPGQRFVVTRRGGFPLVGAWPGEDGGVWVRARFTGRTALARPPAEACARDGAHGRISCPACHEAWVPRCVSCHTRFDASGVMFDLLDRKEAPGEWVEEAAVPSAIGPSTLGARVADGGGIEIESFTPGMILSLSIDGGAPRFQRLFAPIFAHTIRRAPRPCESCHGDPLALGYGAGRLSFVRAGSHQTVSFEPDDTRRLEDGLPPDAWIGFLRTRGSESTTRDDSRPLSVEEQRRILTVGGCLQCHPGTDPMWTRALLHPGLPPLSPRCARVRF